MNTIEELLGMDLARLEAMTDAEILAYLEPALKVQPPIKIAPEVKTGKGVKVSLGSGSGSTTQTRGAIAAGLIKRGPATGDSNVLAILAQVAKESGQAFDADKVLARISKKS